MRTERERRSMKLLAQLEALNLDTSASSGEDTAPHISRQEPQAPRNYAQNLDRKLSL